MLHLSFPTIAIIICAEMNKKTLVISKRQHKHIKQAGGEGEEEDHAIVGSSLFALRNFWHKSFYGDHFFFFIFFLISPSFFGMKRNTKYIMEHRQCLYVVKKREKNKKRNEKKHRKNYLLYTPKLATKKI